MYNYEEYIEQCLGGGLCGRDCKVVVQSVPIITKVVSSSPAHGEMYSIQHYVINLLVTCGRQWFSPGTSANKTDRHDITEILLKVA
jgi:uncharacterized 2Fe-2S/4Fe-4S cluster protein (DUF4445 family)